MAKRALPQSPTTETSRRALISGSCVSSGARERLGSVPGAQQPTATLKRILMVSNAVLPPSLVPVSAWWLPSAMSLPTSKLQSNATTPSKDCFRLRVEACNTGFAYVLLLCDSPWNFQPRRSQGNTGQATMRPSPSVPSVQDIISHCSAILY